MIKITYGVLSDSTPVSLSVGDNVDSLVSRALRSRYPKVELEKLKGNYVVAVDGQVVPREKWELVPLLENSIVVVSPKYGDQETFKVAVTIAVLVYAGPAVASLGWGKLATGLAMTGISMGTTWALNQLIPPPKIDEGGVSIGPGSSQAYAITGQSNQLKRYKSVPKVYGKHRIFPNVAANPYITVVSDKGEVSQFLTAVYDLGLGPMTVEDIRIGDTPISEYADAQYRLVDINRPPEDEGVWDEQLYNEFAFYKGDVNVSEDPPYDLNVNKSVTIPENQWRVTRFAAPGADGDDQEIVIDMVFPNGLISFDSQGRRIDRTVTLEILFSEVSVNDWKSITNPDFVHSYDLRGTGAVYKNPTTTPPVANRGLYQVLSRDWEAGSFVATSYGPRKGENFIIGNSGLEVGARVFLASTNEFLGSIVSSTTSGMPSGFTKYTLDRALKNSIPLYSRQTTKNSGYNNSKSYTWGFTRTATPFYTTSGTAGKISFTARKDGQHYISVSFKPKQIGQFKIRITRESSFSTSNISPRDALTLYRLTTRFDREAITTTLRHVFLELNIRATGQLNGNIQNLSAVCHSVLDVYDTDTNTWIKDTTDNPAWVFADLLTGPVNKRALPKSRLDLDSIIDWAEFCDEVPEPSPNRVYNMKRFGTNFILDYDTTLQEVLNSVANAAQAGLNIIDGKYGVLVDRIRTVPVQIFTPRNSWGFTSQRVYAPAPDLLKVKFIDPDSEWEMNEADVYKDGITENTYETEEELTTFACTNYEQAWRYGRFIQAQSKLRQETISITVDFEYLVCSRGDYVQITQDVMKAGGIPARVRGVSGNTITIDEAIAIEPITYAYIFRSVSGIEPAASLTVIDSKTFELDGEIPSVGDLIVIGESSSVVLDCIVQSITPGDDLTATIVLVEQAKDIYDIDQLAEIPDYDPLFSRLGEESSAPGEVVDLVILENSWRIINNSYQYYMNVDWELPETGAVATFEIYLDTGSGYDLVTVTKNSSYEHIVDPRLLGVEHSFKVLGVSADGSKLNLADVGFAAATPERKSTPPSDVEALFINITGEVLQLDWYQITDPDVAEYLIRYSPTNDGNWEVSIPLLRVDKNTTTMSVQARTGMYFIKAVDLNRNTSAIAARAFTSVPDLFNLNFIAETNDFPDVLGEKDRVIIYGDAVTLEQSVFGPPQDAQFYPEGFYYYKDLLVLSDIFTIRLQSLIEAEGFTPFDLMSNWPTLSDVEALSLAKYDEWDVETQVRFTEQLSVMSQWPSLDVIDPISEGLQDIWGPWQKFIMGDFTGRVFQFRLRLVSNVPAITPRVFDGIIKADVPDRLESYNNIISDDVDGAEIVFDPEFFGPSPGPTIQVTQDNMQQGDYYVIEEKTLSKVVIKFYDKDDNLVSRQFDLYAKGYGRKNDEVIF